MIEQIPKIKQIIRDCLEEDLVSGRDLTTDPIIDAEKHGTAFLIAREDLVLAGLPVFRLVFLELSREMQFITEFDEGDVIRKGQQICLITGPLSAILKGERTAINFLQRMSGIATLTRQYVKRTEAQKTRILDTRKTAPGLRWFDKYAVRMGGGGNHRFGLFDGILIKDNHIAAAGSITRAISLVRNNSPHTLKIEIEVEDLEGAEAAVQAGADVLLLDNMAPQDMHRVVKKYGSQVKLEASGGITLENVEEVAKTGVHFISIGALTHSAKAADMSLEIIPDSVKKEQK